MKTLELLARLCAVLAGLLLIAVALVICVSVAGRNTTGWTIAGDYELTGVVAGAAIALFMPWGQFRRANIIVDFFTSTLQPTTNERLDRVGAALLAVGLGVCAWRAGVGGWHSWSSGSRTMMLGFPEWAVYAVIAPSLVLTAMIALVQAFTGLREELP
ncbi:TRAP transporter small permease [Ramlibacter sp. 2FC]|uniref:TRAP transporter small permease n=1 Tax=Ramlibacter sp. 2FC TaxID=2502188 RepID=UPI0010F56C2F|nr:TRAP transporter small permease [Ramlibacter sp. 2FC]